MWGSGKNGRLGLGSFVDEFLLFFLESLENYCIVEVVCGFDYFFIFFIF